MPQQNVTVFVSNLPTGSIIAYCGTDVPSGWLLCDGSPFSSTTYPELAQLLSSSYTPNLAGKTLIGVGSSSGNTYSLGSTGGEATHKLTINEMPSHRHTLQNYSDSGNTNDNASNWDRNNIQSGVNNTSKVGGDSPHNNMQPYYVVSYIIKAG